MLIQQLDFPGEVYLFELSLAEISPALVPVYTPPSKFPFVRRDLAFVVDERVSYHDICEKIRSCTKDALQDLQLFDIYQGEKIPKGQKSMAISLTFQLASRTLIDQEIDEMITAVINTLKRDFSANLRD
jgi:phenylalanyl-tRNA synthetase beta chain